MSSEQPKTSPIAIIGMACRFPDDANTPNKLWETVAAARNAWSEWPASRINESSFYHPQPEHLGTVSIPPFLNCREIPSSIHLSPPLPQETVKHTASLVVSLHLPFSPSRYTAKVVIS